VAGYLGDIGNRKWIITISLLFWSGATMITGLARGVLDLVLFRSIATAGGESLYAPAAYSLLAHHHRRTRSLAMSVHQSALYLGVIAAGFVGAWLATRWGWRSAFYAFGAVGIVLGFVFIVRLQDAPHGPQASGPPGALPPAQPAARVNPFQAASVLFRTPTACLLTVGFTAIVFVNNAYVVWEPSFVKQKFDLSLEAAGGHAMLYHHLAALAGVLLGGPLSDALLARRPRFRIELQATAMLLGVPTIVWMGLSGSLVGTWLATAALGLCRGLYEANTHAALFDVIPPRYRASAVAMMTMVGFLIGSLSPGLLGQCRTLFGQEQGLSYGFAGLAGAYLIGGIAVLIAVLKTFKKDRLSGG